MSNNRVYLLMIFAALFWSGAFITGKLAICEFTPFSLTFFRFFIALPFIFMILMKMQPEAMLPEKKQWLPLITLGIIGTFAYHALFFYSLKYTTAINASLIGSTLPMITTILASIFVREKVTFPRAVGIVLAFSGIFMVITNGKWDMIQNFQFNLGDIIMFGAVWCWAIYSILSRVFMKKYMLSPITVTAYTFLVCVIISLPFVVNEIPSYISSITTGGWLSVTYMAIFSSVLGYLFQLIAVQKIGAPRAAIFVNLVPVFTIILAVLFLGETINGYKLASTSIIIAGVYLASRPKTTEKNIAFVVSETETERS